MARRYYKAYIQSHQATTIGRNGLSMWVYQGDDYVGRLDMSDAGVAAYSGRKGKKCLCNLNWYDFLVMIARHGGGTR